MEKAVSLTRQSIQEIVIVFFLALLIGFLGKISLFMPMNPIQLALRPQLVILIAWVMGSRRTCFALILFLVFGACEHSFLVTARNFSQGLFGPTFGYLFGYFVVATLASSLKERGVGVAASFLLLSCLLDLLGAIGLALFLGIPQGFSLGFFPFILGDAVKSIVCASAVGYFSRVGR